jgi:hypothetical protein
MGPVRKSGGGGWVGIGWCLIRKRVGGEETPADGQVEHLAQDFTQPVRPHRRRFAILLPPFDPLPSEEPRSLPVNKMLLASLRMNGGKGRIAVGHGRKFEYSNATLFSQKTFVCLT